MLFEQYFAFSLVVFCSHAEISLCFLLFFQFFRSDFFLNGFSNPFIVSFSPSFFVLTELSFLANGFLSACGILTLV